MPELQVIETKELYDGDIALNNLRESSKISHYKFAMSSVYGWLMCNPESNLYDLEKLFRNEKLNIYLIADSNINKGQKLVLPRNVKIDLKFTCVILVNNEEKMDEYIAEHNIIIKDNLENLKYTGFEFDSDVIEEEIHQLKNREEIDNIQDILSQLQHVGIGINIIDEHDPQTQLDNDIKDAIDNHEIVEQRIFQSDEDSNYIEFYNKNDDERVSDWILKINKQNEEMDVINISTILKK
jgi:hypothetical protein